MLATPVGCRPMTRCLPAADASSLLIRPTQSFNSWQNSISVNTSVAVGHDDQCSRKYSSQRQNGLRHAHEAIFAQRAPFGRLVPETVLRETILRDAAWVDPTSTHVAPACASRCVHPTDLADLSSAKHLALVARTVYVSLHTRERKKK